METTWKSRVQGLKRDIKALALAYQDPRVPWYAKLWVACVVAYALSPIDLIPDFIPVLGYLDDVILLPLGILLAIKMIPDQVFEECRQKAETAPTKPKKKWAVAALIIFIWAFFFVWIATLVYNWLR